MIDTAAVNQMIARLAEAPKGAKADGRKVRTPQGSAPGNARSGQPEGKWHRKYTARLRSRPLRASSFGAASSSDRGLPRRSPEPEGRRAKVGKGEKVR